MIAEMIHTASLMHDDVIDHADTRRGKSSINSVWGQRKVSFFLTANTFLANDSGTEDRCFTTVSMYRNSPKYSDTLIFGHQ